MRSKAALGLLGLGGLAVLSAALGASIGSTLIDLPAALGELLRAPPPPHPGRPHFAPRAAAPGVRLSAVRCLPLRQRHAHPGGAVQPPRLPQCNWRQRRGGVLHLSGHGAGPRFGGCGAYWGLFRALAATLLVYAVAAGAGAGKLTIILAGVAVSSIFTAGINTIKTFFPDTLYNGSTFLIGGFSGVSFSDLSPAWLMILPALVLAFLMARPTDVLCLGEETAHSLGLPVNATRFGLILIACVLAGAAVSFSGLVSFVGLLCPHIVRRMFGQGRHRVLLPAAALLGAGFVTLCDLFSRVLFAPYEIPVGILLSFLGGPFFLFLIVKQRRRPPRPGRKGASG